MNNLLLHCGLVDVRISASEKDLPVSVKSTVKILSIIVAFSENTNFILGPVLLYFCLILSKFGGSLGFKKE